MKAMVPTSRLRTSAPMVSQLVAPALSSGCACGLNQPFQRGRSLSA